MDNKELISYAILDVNYYNDKDYLSNFEPFLLEVIKSTSPEIIASQDLKEGIMNEFGLDIPLGVIKTICSKLEKKSYLNKKLIVGTKDKYSYVPNFEKIDKTDFKEKSKEVVESFNKLIKDYREFLDKNFELKLDTEECIEQFEMFIKKNNVSLISKNNTADKENDKSIFLVGKFVEDIHKNNQSGYRVFLNIVKGNMLSEAIYYDDSGSFKNKFKGTKFYFDTSFMMYALGYSGEKRKLPCTELLSLIKKNGGELFCFEHNITEMIGILSWSKHNLNSGKDSHDTINYFRNNRIDESGIDFLISNLRYTIESELNITISENVSFNPTDYSKVIDYSGLMEYLKSKIHYNKEEALENDVESVASIMRLRKKKTASNIEDCEATFVTTNGSLCRVVKEFLTSEGKLGIPPILTDSVVTNLVWLKNPEIYPNLPSIKLIADCYAATNPSDRLWNKYIERIDKLIESGKIIDKNEIVTLRYLNNSKEILMNITMGDENAITEGTAKDVLAEIERQKQEEIKIKIEEEQRKAKRVLQNEKDINSVLQNKLAEKVLRDKNQIERIRRDSELTAKCVVNVLIVLLAFLFGWVSFVSLGHTQIDPKYQWMISIIVGVIIPVIGFISSSLGFESTEYINKIKKKISSFYFRKICEKYELDFD